MLLPIGIIFLLSLSFANAQDYTYYYFPTWPIYTAVILVFSIIVSVIGACCRRRAIRQRQLQLQAAIAAGQAVAPAPYVPSSYPPGTYPTMTLPAGNQPSYPMAAAGYPDGGGLPNRGYVYGDQDVFKPPPYSPPPPAAYSEPSKNIPQGEVQPPTYEQASSEARVFPSQLSAGGAMTIQYPPSGTPNPQ